MKVKLIRANVLTVVARVNVTDEANMATIMSVGMNRTVGPTLHRFSVFFRDKAWYVPMPGFDGLKFSDEVGDARLFHVVKMLVFPSSSWLPP